MANTTDVMIVTHCGDQKAIDYINRKAGITFEELELPKPESFDKYIAFTVYGLCKRTLGEDVMDRIVEAFKSAEFETPDHVSLHMEDDSSEKYEGIILKTDQGNW